MNGNNQWPAWFNGPNGETQIFHSSEDVPAGWTSGAEKRLPGKPSPTPKPSPPPPPASPTTAGKPELDVNGHPWSADLYAPTKTKTGAGLWRMKVGRARPAPAAGYPLDL